MKTKLFIAISTLLLFLAAVALAQEKSSKPGYGKDTEGKARLVLCKKVRTKMRRVASEK